MTTHTGFHAILSISVDKPNIRLDIRPDIRIKFLLSQVLYNDIMHTCINFHANTVNIKKVNKPDIRIATKIERDLFWHCHMNP